MFKTLVLIAVFSLSGAGGVMAQPAQPPHPSWDVAITAGSFHGYPGEDLPSGYQDDWYHDAEGRLTVGRYWNAHLKTEVEFGQTGEGDRYVPHFTTVPGSTTLFPYTAQDFFRVRQASARVAWQFLDNQVIHPYLFAGLSVDEQHKRTLVHESRTGRIRDAIEGPRTTYRPGVVVGGGAKWYVSSSVFVKTAAQFSYARPASSVSFQFGMGVDF